MDNMDIWKKERISVVNTFLKNKEYILLRGAKSWNLNSDIDVLCPTFEQDEDLRRYVVKSVEIDIFTVYAIKSIKIDYQKLLKFKDATNNELDENIEAILFFIKDYIHFTKYRKNKHIFYQKPINMQGFLKEINCPRSMQYFLKPSNNIISFFMRSIIVKIIYYTTR
jgi:hypothetical protein